MARATRIAPAGIVTPAAGSLNRIAKKWWWVVVAIPVLVGLRTAYNWRTQPSSPYLAAPARVTATISPHCPGEMETVRVGQTPVVINPGGRCIIKWRVDAPLKFIDHSGASITVGPEGGNYDSFWGESAQAAGSQDVTLHYRLVTS